MHMHKTSSYKKSKSQLTHSDPVKCFSLLGLVDASSQIFYLLNFTKVAKLVNVNLLRYKHGRELFLSHN